MSEDQACLPWRSDPPVHPQASFVFEVTQRCNLDCLHCYNAWKNPIEYPGGQLEPDETLAMLGRMLDQTGAPLVTLTGGEPLLRPDLPRIASYLKGRGVTVNLISNGTLLDETVVARLDGLMDMFELPLLSCDARIHDRMSGTPGAFDRVTMAMATLKAMGRRLVAVFVATRLNLPTLEETLELAFALGVDGVMLNRFNPGGRGFDNVELLQVSPESLAEALDLANAFSRRHEFPIACSIAMPPCLFEHSRYEQLSFGFCSAGTERAYYTLDPLGNVRPCNHSPRILGNIRRNGFAEMASGERMDDFRRARPEFCAGCGREEECQGGCKAAAEACAGSPWACDPFLASFAGQARRPARQGRAS